MNDTGYIEKIKPLIHYLDGIDNEMLDVLALFVFQNHLSSYQIHKIIARYGKKIAYKNSRQKVQKLIDLKLIEKETDLSKFKEKELDKGAKYYKLSEEGIFVLFYNSRVFLEPSVYYVQRAFENGKTVDDVSHIYVEYKKEIFKNHQDSSFFELFLLPWISIETVESASEELYDNIRLFLNYCCSLVKDHIIGLSKRTDELEESTALIYIDKIKSQDPFLGMKSVNVDDVSLFSYVTDISLDRPTLVKIKRDKNKNIILLIKSLDSNQTILLYKDKENIPTIVSLYKNTDGSSLFTHSIKHKQIKLLAPLSRFKFEYGMDLKSLYNKAVFSIVSGKPKDDDLRFLKEDVKFEDTLSELKKTFNDEVKILAK